MGKKVKIIVEQNKQLARSKQKNQNGEIRFIFLFVLNECFQQSSAQLRERKRECVHNQKVELGVVVS